MMSKLVQLFLFISVLVGTESSFASIGSFSKICGNEILLIPNTLPPVATLSSLRRYTNIRPSPPAARERLPTDIDYFELDAQTKKIKQKASDGSVTAEFENLQAFASQFDLGNAYFPFVFDTANPNQIQFGIGSDVQLADESFAPRSLVRNGGHMQLAIRYRGSNAPDTNGLFGGGISFVDGNAEIDFRSRSVNRTAGGVLTPAQEQTLRNAILPILH
jgi:hypothetical protein